MGSRRGRTAVRRLSALALGACALLAARPARAAEGAPLSLRADSLRVTYWPGHEEMARRTLRAARVPLLLPGLPGGRLRVAGEIVLAPDPAAFDSLTSGLSPAWSAGVAIPSRRLIILPAYHSRRTVWDDPAVTLRHELAHLALHDYLGDAVPRWFDEGYATWVSGGLDESAGWQIRFAFLLGRAPPLDSLTLAWPRGEGQARLAYLLSASAVRHLATRSGDPAFRALMLAWDRLGSLDAAMRATYGMTLGQFEKEWRALVKRRYGWLLAVSQVGAFWVAVTLLVLLLGASRRRRDRARLAQMEAQEEGAEDEGEWMLPLAEEPAEGAPDGVDDPRREG